MTDRDTCKYPTCSNTPRDSTEVGRRAGRFCSTACMLKFEHVKADARDAKRSAEREARPDRTPSTTHRGP